MATIYRIFLTHEERIALDSIVKKGKNAAIVILTALVLLFCDLSADGRGHKTNSDYEVNANDYLIRTALATLSWV